MTTTPDEKRYNCAPLTVERLRQSADKIRENARMGLICGAWQAGIQRWAADTIEAQAAELEQANDIRDDAINVLATVAEELGVDQEPHQTFNERLIEAAEKDWYKAYMESSWELAQARARIGRLEAGVVLAIHSLRDHWQAGGTALLVASGLQDIVNESEPQPLAAVRAEVLRDEARQWREAGNFEVKRTPDADPDKLVQFYIANQLEAKAERIEREAKESE